MRITGLALLLQASLAAGCLTSNATVCEDGHLCPSGSQCHATLGCVLDEQVQACAARADGDPCTFSGSDGHCQDGACVGPRCGDDLLDPGEECDGEVFAISCLDLDYYEDTPATCVDCMIDRDTCTGGRCGDGVANGPEDCDGADLAGATCQLLGFYEEPGLGCTTSCLFDPVACVGRCGDRVLDDEELCEGGAPPTQSCVDFGFESGALSCRASCGPDASGCTAPTWITQVATTDLRAVWASGPDDAFALTAGGGIVHWDGVAWTAMASGTAEVLTGVSGTASDNVVAVGGAAARRWNGTAWSDLGPAFPFGTSLAGVWVAAEDDAFAVGGSGAIRRWNGTSWTTMTSGTTEDLGAVWGSGPDDVFAGGANGTILHWDGATWDDQSVSTTTYPFVDIWGSGPDDVYVVGEFTLHWNGTTWTQSAAGPHGLYGVGGTGPDAIFAVNGDGQVLQRTGEVWTPTTSTTGALYDVAAAGADVVAVGGSIIRRIGAAWTLGAIDALAWPRSVWGVAPNDVYAVGYLGQVVHWDGSSWASESVPPVGDFEHVWASGADDVYVVGPGILHKSGGSWSTTFPGAQFLGVHGAGSGAVFAVGLDGAIQHSDGSTWTPMTSGTTAHLFDVWVAAPDDAFAVGDAGTILRCDGDSWSAMTSGTTGLLRAVWGAASDDVYAVGHAGVMLHWDGATWTPLASGTTENLHTVSGTSPRDVYVGGDDGLLLHWDGLAWSPMATRTGASIDGIWAGRDVFALSSEGISLHRARSCSTGELRCSDGVDDDCDGYVDCSEAECAGEAECAAGGACSGATAIACGDSVNASTTTSPAVLERYACDPWLELGREAIYRLDAIASGDVTVTLTGLDKDLDLVVLAEGPGGACETHLPGCLGASSTTGDEAVTFAADAGTSYWLVVDGYAGDAGSYTLDVACD